jgi:SecD/SecF fusion protein
MLVQLPGLQDPTRLRQLLGSTAKMTFHMVANVDPGNRLPPGVSLLPDAKTGATYPVEDRVALTAPAIDARAGDRHQELLVSFRFDGEGARQFAAITSANVGKPFAIVLDGKVLSAGHPRADHRRVRPDQWQFHRRGHGHASALCAPARCRRR